MCDNLCIARLDHIKDPEVLRQAAHILEDEVLRLSSKLSHAKKRIAELEGRSPEEIQGTLKLLEEELNKSLTKAAPGGGSERRPRDKNDNDGESDKETKKRDRSGPAPQSKSNQQSDSQADTTSNGISAGYVQYERGLVRLDFPDGGRCSGFLLSNNMIGTAAHCLNRRTVTGSHEGVWNGMKWAEIRMRIVYKPSQTESMCLNETCRNSNGSRRYTTVLAFWDNGYSYDVETRSDVAFITRLAGGTFPTRASMPGDPAPRSIYTVDLMRLLAANMPVGYTRVRGYGANADGSMDFTPREGTMYIEHYGSQEIRGEVRWGFGTICEGDFGGPLVYDRYDTFTPHSRNYVAGVASRTGPRSNECPETGDNVYWARLSDKLWMVNHILEWSGRSPCRSYTDSNLPGNQRYYTCW